MKLFLRFYENGVEGSRQLFRSSARQNIDEVIETIFRAIEDFPKLNALPSYSHESDIRLLLNKKLTAAQIWESGPQPVDYEEVELIVRRWKNYTTTEPNNYQIIYRVNVEICR